MNGDALLQEGFGPGVGPIGHRARVVVQPSVIRPDHRLDRHSELPGELEVALVVGGHAHDGAAAIARQDVVGDEDRHRFARRGVCGKVPVNTADLSRWA